MADYETFCQIRDHLVRQQLSVVQTARALRLDVRTVAKWAEAEQYHSRRLVPRSSKLDAFMGQIVLWLVACREQVERCLGPCSRAGTATHRARPGARVSEARVTLPQK